MTLDELERQPDADLSSLRHIQYAASPISPALQRWADDDGYMYMVDRLKDMIVTAGEKRHSIDAEAALVEHEAVQEAAAFGIPHPRWGEAVHAVVTLAERATVTPEELVAHCRKLIAGYKVPRSIHLRTSEPDRLPLVERQFPRRSPSRDRPGSRTARGMAGSSAGRSRVCTGDDFLGGLWPEAVRAAPHEPGPPETPQLAEPSELTPSLRQRRARARAAHQRTDHRPTTTRTTRAQMSPLHRCREAGKGSGVSQLTACGYGCSRLSKSQ